MDYLCHAFTCNEIRGEGRSIEIIQRENTLDKHDHKSMWGIEASIEVGMIYCRSYSK